MGALRSLRGRVAVLATLAVAGVLLAVGAVSVASLARDERDRVDDALRARPVAELVGALRGGRGPGGRPDLGPPALRPEGEYVRLVAGGAAIAGVDVPPGLPVPERPGLRTLSADGTEYRSLARVAPGLGLLEVGRDLGPSEARVDAMRNRLLLIGLAGAGLVAAVSWWLAGLALRPLGALRAAAGRVSGTRDLSARLPAEGAPAEVAGLGASINAMLGRLERSARETEEALQATRRFAADAGHELRTPMTALRTELGTLRRNPGLAPEERARSLAAAERDAERAMRMLDALQTLARGDAGAALPREPVDVAAVAEAAVEGARARHPEVTWTLVAPEAELAVEGWPDGLRALVDNLLDNAARHGRRGGSVRVELAPAGGEVVLLVDDDGPGVPAPERERVFARFARGAAARAPGSGLGLALVRQQARLHGGHAVIEDAPAGGARVRVRLAAAGDGGAPLRS